MFERFRHQMSEALIHRQREKLPNVAPLITGLVACTVFYILLAIVTVPSHIARNFHFVSEIGAITALSSFLLASASSFSLASLVIHLLEDDRRVWLWIIMMIGFAFLAFDELLQFHERLGNIISRYADSGIFRNWNDIIVILYGVVALPILLALLPTLMRYKMVVELFIVSFVFYGIHTFIDSTQEPNTTVSTILEESAKLLSVEFLAIGAFVGFLGILWNFTPSNSARSGTGGGRRE